MKFALRSLAVLLVGFTLQAQAQGDAAAGETNAAVCAACHGIDGNSMVAQWPKIAGQHESYLARQLALIKDGARPVPEMAAIAASLEIQDMQNLAAYYAGQARSPGVADEALVDEGEQIYRAGITGTSVPACMACHGPAGEGNPLAGYPAVAGQHALYTSNMLKKFRQGTTWGEEDAPSLVMAGVAKKLTDAEIDAVSSYIQGLHHAGE